jgi:Ca-activated chloride channel family protein
VTFSSGVETVVPMTRATVEQKGSAMAQIGRIFDDGGTCISCGIDRGVAELAHSPISGGLRRMVLMSDGQANDGIYDRGELAQLAAQTAAKGVSLSTVGVGLDFDEITMTNLAANGHGNYYFVEDTANLSAMFAHELGGLADTVASDARLVITPGTGVRVLEAYGYPITMRGIETVIPIADLRAGETRKVVVRVMVAAPVGPLEIAQVHLGWRRVADGSLRHATTAATAEMTNDGAQVAASADRPTVHAVELAQTAHALEQATAAYEKDGYDAAQRVMQHRADQMRANAAAIADPKFIEETTAEGSTMIRSFAVEPEKAKTVMRTKAYDLFR